MKDTKYIVLLCDGLSDEPQVSLNGKTISEYANIPNINALAAKGTSGLVHTTPEGMSPGSDICNLSVFGYDPKLYYSGRSPLEALSKGIELNKNDIAIRCNLVTLSDNMSVMEDFSAYHINDTQASIAIERLNKMYKGSNIEFYHGLGYRHLIVIRDFDCDLKTIPPHDIVGQKIDSYLPKGKGHELFNKLMLDTRAVFDNETGRANSIWLWGEGKKPSLPSYKSIYGKSGAVVAAVDLIKGIGTAAGMEIINVPGATGFLDTNFKGKAEYAIRALENFDYVFLHVEATDEAGHMGSIEEKVKAIENIDSLMLPIVKEGLSKYQNHRLLIMPDHPTPVRIKTHTNSPVPALIYGTKVGSDGNLSYSENIKPSFVLKDGFNIAKLLFSETIV